MLILKEKKTKKKLVKNIKTFFKNNSVGNITNLTLSCINVIWKYNYCGIGIWDKKYSDDAIVGTHAVRVTGVARITSNTFILISLSKSNFMPSTV